MAQKTAQQQRLADNRALALATVLLTRRRDLEVHLEPADLGIDLLVTLHQENKEGLRQFGVELKAVFAGVTPAHANSVLRPSMHQMRRFGPFPFPVVLLFFTMQNNEGWYTWVVEPIVSSDGGFALRQLDRATCQPLDDRAIDQIIERVDTWFDAFFAKTNNTISSRGRTKGAGQ